MEGGERDNINPNFTVIKGDTAFKNTIAVIILKNEKPVLTISEFLFRIDNKVVECMKNFIGQGESVKFSFNLNVLYKKISGEEKLFKLNTSTIIIFQGDNIARRLDVDIYPQFDKQNDEMRHGGSGWVFKNISELENL